jgi:hypothetical protein
MVGGKGDAMDQRLTEFRLDDGSIVYVETAEPVAPKAAGVEDIGRAGDVAREASQTLEATLDGVRPAIEAIGRKLRDIVGAADELTVKFGVKLSADAGVIFAKAGAEANFEFTVKWTRASS